jgi:hypothetical protein
VAVNLPVAQSAHTEDTVAPVPVANLPATQPVQVADDDAADALEYEPAPHRVQVLARLAPTVTE